MDLQHKPFRIGILGGMGPMAGVLLQKLIIEATPAERDQGHVQVVCFTNPKIPDRACSLKEDNGEAFCIAIKESFRVLTRTNVHVIVIACNTAHVKFREIQAGTEVPIVNLISLTAQKLKNVYGDQAKIGVLATDALLGSELYQTELRKNNQDVILPDANDQKKLMGIMYAIKANALSGVEEGLKAISVSLIARGVNVILLGCTELSLYFQEIQSLGVRVEDPLRVVAKYLVGIKHESIDKIGTLGMLPAYEDWSAK